MEVYKLSQWLEGKVRLGCVYLSVRSGLRHATIWISDDYQVILVCDHQYYYVEYNLTAEVIHRVVVSPCTKSLLGQHQNPTPWITCGLYKGTQRF